MSGSNAAGFDQRRYEPSVRCRSFPPRNQAVHQNASAPNSQSRSVTSVPSVRCSSPMRVFPAQNQAVHQKVFRAQLSILCDLRALCAMLFPGARLSRPESSVHQSAFRTHPLLKGASFVVRLRQWIPQSQSRRRRPRIWPSIPVLHSTDHRPSRPGAPVK
jgi:hypothetical protein